MFEVWAKRKDTGQYEFICSYNDDEEYKHDNILDLLNNDEYEETIILRDKNYVMMKIYEKGKVLRR